jgi:D-sedoheptulose 7-phosphate isomerase
MKTPEELAVLRIQEHIAIARTLLEDKLYLLAVGEVSKAMSKALAAGHKILFFGNGGSAADAQHFAAELAGRFLAERRGLPGIALTTNTSVLTAIGNDYSFEDVFARQLDGLGVAGDVAFGISTSGNSKNVLRAVEAAAKKKMVTIGLCGRGGKLKDIVDHCICMPSEQTPRIQEAHILTGHILCEIIEWQLLSESNA